MCAVHVRGGAGGPAFGLPEVLLAWYAWTVDSADASHDFSAAQFEAAMREGVDSYKPNSVTVCPDVPEVRLNCKDGVMPLMAREAIRIVTEELRAAGLTSAELYTPPNGS